MFLLGEGAGVGFACTVCDGQEKHRAKTLRRKEKTAGMFLLGAGAGVGFACAFVTGRKNDRAKTLRRQEKTMLEVTFRRGTRL